MLALSSDVFQALALGWLSAATIVLAALFTLIFRFWPQIVELKTRIDALHSRQDRQGERQNSQETAINQVALAAGVQPAETSSAPTPVRVPEGPRV